MDNGKVEEALRKVEEGEGGVAEAELLRRYIAGLVGRIVTLELERDEEPVFSESVFSKSVNQSSREPVTLEIQPMRHRNRPNWRG